MTYSYNIQDDKKVPIILKWLGREGLQGMQTLNNEEQEIAKISTGLFDMLSLSHSTVRHYYLCNSAN